MTRRTFSLLQRSYVETPFVPLPPPVLFQWSRWLKRAGSVSPHASLSDFSGDWTTITGSESEYLVSDPPTRESVGLLADYKLKPMRYEFGIAAGWETVQNISGSQRNVGPREFAPPTSTGGHLQSIDVTSIVVPSAVFCRTQFTDYGNGQSSVLRAIGISKNGTHIAIVDFGSSVPIFAAASASLFYKQHAEQTIAVSMTLVETDTIQIDYYIHAIADTLTLGRPICVNYPAANNYGAILVAPGTTTPGFATITGALTFNSVESRVDDATGHKVVFSNNYPGGLSEIAFASAPSGWSLQTFAGGIRVNKNDGTFIVTFGWMQEIPYLEIFDASKLSTAGYVRYRPDASGDFDTIDVAVVSGSWTQEYGIWKYETISPFSNRVAKVTLAGQGPWFSDDEYASMFTGYPDSVAIVPNVPIVDIYDSGSGNWEAPFDGTVEIEGWGPGGGGGGGNSAGGGNGGGGGGGGGYFLKTLTVTAGDLIPYAVGSGGTSGAYGSPGTDGGNGGTTTVAGGTYTANGGAGGLYNSAATAAGGTASGGDTNTTGSTGSGNSGSTGGSGGASPNGGATVAGTIPNASSVANGNVPGGGAPGGAGGINGTSGGVGSNGRVKFAYTF